MTEIEPRLLYELGEILEKGTASRDFLTPAQIEQHTHAFNQVFGPDRLSKLDGLALLELMHGRQDSETRCLAYWLEFKNDDEFAGNLFGGIGGGSALKFGVYQRQEDSAWITGSPRAKRTLSTKEAISIARQQRDELLEGARLIAQIVDSDTSDQAYGHLQAAIGSQAPTLAKIAWAHKYWCLNKPDRIDTYHSPRYQRFHLFKLLQMSPDNEGILNSNAPRFISAGRFVYGAHQLGVPLATFGQLLQRRHGAFHRYWKIGTTEGSNGESRWPEMLGGGFVSIGWKEQVPDLSGLIKLDRGPAKSQIRAYLASTYDDPGTATRKAGEILDFAQGIAENDFVLACEGQTVLAVGRVRGPYLYSEAFAFPHLRPVEWLLVDRWQLKDIEGPRTTVYELGRSARNLLEIESRVALAGPVPESSFVIATAPKARPSLAALDPFSARISAILSRKGQVILYGPPGTGKTYRALGVARELAARQAFSKSFNDLSVSQQSELDDMSGLVRLCTFHPGWGYEDFVEGLRPKTIDGHMVFEPSNGVFKKLCTDAVKQPERHFFLVIDEINRGDLPRIFGELLTTVELDKRERPVTLPVTGETFSVPKNIFLIGTMNTADRSISIMDAALRRRFGFVELMPDSSILAGRKAGGLPLGPWLDALNARLRRLLKRDARNLQVGHAYLMPPQPILSVADFSRVLRDDLIPLLEEYCYDDFLTLREILGQALVDVDRACIREEIFGPNREEELIQAVSFEEMQAFVLDEVPSDSALVAESFDLSEEEAGADAAS